MGVGPIADETTRESFQYAPLSVKADTESITIYPSDFAINAGSPSIPTGLLIPAIALDPTSIEILVESAEDLVGEPPLEGPNRGPLRVAACDPSGDVVVAQAVVAPLADSDAVDRGVGLAVSASAEPELHVACPDWDRCCAVPPGEG